MIIENSLNQNKQLKGAQVYELGIADALFEGADFLEQSLLWTASVLSGTIAYGGSSQGAVNAGTYTIIPSNQTSSNYAINYVDGTLTINPAG